MYYINIINIFSLIFKMTETLKLGEHPKNTYWTVRGDTGVPSHHLNKFYKCGVSFKEYKGTVWVIRSLKILRPFDTVTKEHLDLLSVYDNYKLNDEPTSTEEYNGPLPFSTFGLLDYTAMALVGGDGPRSTWSNMWINGKLHVYTNEGEKIYKPYGNNLAPGDSGYSGTVLKQKTSSDTKPTPVTDKPNVVVSDDDSDDEDMFDLFG
jgi:hypothetical protein